MLIKVIKPTNMHGIYDIYRLSHPNLGRSIPSLPVQANDGKAGGFTWIHVFGLRSLWRGSEKQSYLWPKETDPFEALSLPVQMSANCRHVFVYCTLGADEARSNFTCGNAEVYRQDQPSLPFMLCFQSCYLNLIGILFLPSKLSPMPLAP